MACGIRRSPFSFTYPSGSSPDRCASRTDPCSQSHQCKSDLGRHSTETISLFRRRVIRLIQLLNWSIRQVRLLLSVVSTVKVRILHQNPSEAFELRTYLSTSLHDYWKIWEPRSWNLRCFQSVVETVATVTIIVSCTLEAICTLPYLGTDMIDQGHSFGVWLRNMVSGKTKA